MKISPQIYQLVAVIVLFVLNGQFSAIGCEGGDKAPIQGGKIVVLTVDVATVIAFHPAMRAFDYRSGKFVQTIPERPNATGLLAWKQLISERNEIASLEEKLLTQSNKINEKLMALYAQKNNIASSTNLKLTVEIAKEREKLKEINKKHRKLLKELVGKIFGEFPDGSFTDLPKDQIDRIISEIQWAIKTAARKHGAAFVLNSPISASPRPVSSSIQNIVKSAKENILDTLGIQKLVDIENIMSSIASGTWNFPAGQSLPQGDPNKPCGGHFESISDPKMLKTLFGEYFDNRSAFSAPFKKHGIDKLVWEGTLELHEKNVTLEVLDHIFNLYKTRQIEREAAWAIIKERMGF